MLDGIKFGYKFFHRIVLVFTLLLIFVSIGIIGYILIEDYTFLEAFYMTIISITTVGYLEVKPLSDAGRIFTSFFLISNIGLFFYGVTLIASHIVEGEFRNFFKHYNLNKQIDKITNHVIICGYGRTGRQVCTELKDDKIPFLVIENREKVIEHIREDGVLFLEGNATEEETLIKAGIKSARALITTLPNDPDNVYVVLTARELNPHISIISRASNEPSESKLRRAGANNVIMPEKIGGAHMAALVSKPDILEFVAQLIGQGSDISLTFEEISLKPLYPDSQLKSIRDLDVRNKTGANIIGLRMPGGTYIVNPSPDTKINPDIKLILLGSHEQIQKMRTLISEIQ